MISRRYNVNFVGMVLPGDELIVKTCHIGIRDGNIDMKIETNNGRGEKVLKGSAEVAQPNTVRIYRSRFTGARDGDDFTCGSRCVGGC